MPSLGSASSVLRFLVTVVVFTLALALAAEAQGQPQPQPQNAPRRALIQYSGADGYWFRMDVARELLDALDERPLHLYRIDRLEERVEHDNGKISRLEEAVDLGRQAEARLERALRHSEHLRVEAVGTRNAWYRSPWLYLTIGGIVGISGTLLVSYFLMR